MNDNVFRSIRPKYLVPPDHSLLIAGDNLLDLSCKNGLQGRAVLDRVQLHEFLDARVAFPLLDVTFVPSCVEIPVGEETCHFTYESSQKLVNVFTGGVKGGAMRGLLTTGQN